MGSMVDRSSQSGALQKTRTPGVFIRHGKRGDTRYLDTFFQGVQIKEALGRVSQAEAEAELRRIQSDIADAKPTSSRSARSLTVLDILNYRGVHYLADRKPEYRQWCKYLFDALADKIGGIRFSDLKKSVIERYKRDRESDGVGPRTIQAELQQLNMALNFCVDDDYIPHNPVARFCRVSQGEPKKIVLDDGHAWGEHWQAIYDNVSSGWEQSRPSAWARNRALVLLLYETGMRPVEAFRMRHDWWHEVRDGYWIIEVPEEAEKTSKRSRRIPVSSVLWESMREILTPGRDELLFPSGATGRQRGQHGIEKTFRNAVERAGLQRYGYTPYCLRRTRVTIWDKIDEGACRAAVGHSAGKDSHRRNYSHVGMDRLFKLVGKTWDYELKLVKSA